MKQVKAFIERNNEGIYSVYIDLEDTTLNYGIHGTGKTSKEALNDFNTSYKEMKAFYKEKGRDFIEADFSFQYDIASFLSYYSKFISLAGLQRITGVHQGQLSHYLTGHRKPSKKTAEKIEQKIRNFGEELAHLEIT